MLTEGSKELNVRIADGLSWSWSEDHDVGLVVWLCTKICLSDSLKPVTSTNININIGSLSMFHSGYLDFLRYSKDEYSLLHQTKDTSHLPVWKFQLEELVED